MLQANLIKANQILADVAIKDANITPVTLDDYGLFQNFFDKEPHTYGNSWTYITQGVYGTGPNNLGYKYYDGENLSIMCFYPKIEDRNTIMHYWIRPMGPSILDKIVKISQQVKKTYKINTYVKKIFNSQLKYLNQHGFSDSIKYPWHTKSHAEDDTYPEQIFEIDHTLSKLKEYSRRTSFREMHRRTQRMNRDFNIKITREGFEQYAPQIAKDFFNMQIIKDGGRNFSCKEDYLNPIKLNPERINLSKRIVYVDNKPMAFYVFEELDDKYSCLYAQLTLRNKFKDLADYLFFHIFKNTKTKYLNLGGSEDIGIKQFKDKYKPIKLLQMNWATNY